MKTLLARPWIWAWVAAALAFALTAAISQNQGAWGLAVAALTFSAFSVIVGLGQMFVITLGPGNVDLSIPATMTLAGTVSLKVMDGGAGAEVTGLAIALAIGAGVGLTNYLLILLIRIPPIIATLAASFLYQSLAIWSNRGLRVKPPESLAEFAVGRSLGLPNLALLALVLSVLAWVALNRAAYGRQISAIGQNPRAARLSGLPVEAVRLATYMLCAVLAGLCGFLLSCFSGGAALNMGQEYLLASIAVVVIGGSSIGGGRSNVPGIWAGALFLFLIVSMLNSYGLGAGVRLLMTGLIIIAIVAVGSRGPRGT
ncbi:ABC transporter permease [Szabonella alba]|uniref:ABC transporter permease n=1 Tax=Szabonella alba TaxID=2804194 RepID=A0A8K0VD25_9RHOB|nr:ABC transporter permease [Szabonella alba]MBL4918846.1 ABC transporter permease [Szabonella alba]